MCSKQEDASGAPVFSSERSQTSRGGNVPPEDSSQDGYRRDGGNFAEGVQDRQDALHSVGECTPCNYYLSRGTCKIGDTCKYCHQPHEKARVKPRPRKGIRKYCKGAVGQLDVIALINASIKDQRCWQNLCFVDVNGSAKMSNSNNHVLTSSRTKKNHKTVMPSIANNFYFFECS